MKKMLKMVSLVVQNNKLDYLVKNSVSLSTADDSSFIRINLQEAKRLSEELKNLINKIEKEGKNEY
jgi:hypothetical protein